MELINQILQESVNQIRSALQQLQPEPFIESLPSVLIENEETYKQLPPDITTVYFLTHPIEELLYVGKTSNLFIRWRPTGHTHECLEPAIRLKGVRLSWWALDVDLLPAVEEILIKLWRPQWNGGVTGWIRKYRPELEWPDDIDDRSISSSESRRGHTGQRAVEVAKLMRQKIVAWR